MKASAVLVRIVCNNSVPNEKVRSLGVGLVPWAELFRGLFALGPSGFKSLGAESLSGLILKGSRGHRKLYADFLFT